MPHVITSYDEAVAFLDGRVGTGVKPGLERIAGLLALMGDPHHSYPIVHVAGTNGKTTTTRMIADLLGAHGLTVGAFTSPHLQAVEERFFLSGRWMTREEFVRAVSDVAPFVEAFEARHGESVTYFEVTAAMALSAFADAAVDVAVVEVGLGGRWDATNVVEAEVSVITGVAMDHMEWLGRTLPEIGAEKVAILKDGGTLVTAPLDASVEGVVTARVAETGSRWFRAGTEYRVAAAEARPAGWVIDLDGAFDTYDGIQLNLLGRHQVTNFATAVTAVEAFFGRGLDHLAVRAAAGAVTSPGRLEAIGTSPLVLLDGAHNEEAFHALAGSLLLHFAPGPWHLVAGFRGERDVAVLLTPLAGMVDRVWATAASDPAAIPVGVVATAAGEVFDVPIVREPSVAAAVDAAVRSAGPEGRVLVTGSLYAVGEARSGLVTRAGVSRDAAVFVHIEAEIDETDEIIDLDEFESDEYGFFED